MSRYWILGWSAAVYLVVMMVVMDGIEARAAAYFVVLVACFHAYRDFRERRAEQRRGLRNIPTPDPGPVEQAAADPSSTAWHYGHHGGLYYGAEGRIMADMHESWTIPESVAERHRMSTARAKLLLDRLAARGALITDGERYRVATPQERKANKERTGIQP